MIFSTVKKIFWINRSSRSFDSHARSGRSGQSIALRGSNKLALFLLFMGPLTVHAMDTAAKGTQLLKAIRYKKVSKINQLAAQISLNCRYKEDSVKLYIPLNYAILWGNKKIVELLVDRGAPVNARCERSFTPLHWAVRFSLLEIIAILLKRGAEVNAQADTGETPLFVAVVHRDAAEVQLLLNNGAQVDVVDEDKYTPLHLAARHASFQVVKKILHSQPNVNAKAKDGVTPLYEAVIALVRKEEETEAIIQVLLDKQADSTVIVFDKTVLQHAQECRGQKAQGMLKDSLKKQ